MSQPEETKSGVSHGDGGCLGGGATNVLHGTVPVGRIGLALGAGGLDEDGI